MAHTRQQILKRLRKLISTQQPIIGGGAGTGITAKFEEAGGVDLIVIYKVVAIEWRVAVRWLA